MPPLCCVPSALLERCSHRKQSLPSIVRSQILSSFFAWLDSQIAFFKAILWDEPKKQLKTTSLFSLGVNTWCPVIFKQLLSYMQWQKKKKVIYWSSNGTGTIFVRRYFIHRSPTSLFTLEITSREIIILLHFLGSFHKSPEPGTNMSHISRKSPTGIMHMLVICFTSS